MTEEKQLADPATLPAWRIRQDTLSSINSHRRKAGLEPLTAIPKGRPGDSFNCPISNGTNKIPVGFWRGDPDNPQMVLYPNYPNADGRIPLSRASAEFVRRFDLGQFPEYIQ